ncbi:N-acyl amino acid synthase FeeM domain-containing protein [Novosphingobium sp. M1R2S20]|uniref:Acetyltransferase n=1 Tax=Novosphingobium rhizovicinum TaxID=3228928 RepID=A0ABV3RCZ3_9SPHN
MSIHMLNHQFENASYGQIAARRRANSVKPSALGSKAQMALSLADTPAERSAAEAMLNRRYDWRGYGSNHKISDADNHTTFLAHLRNQLVGTLTLGVDSPSGLAIDTLFKKEVDEYRNVPGAQVCELTKFAFETEEKGADNSLLACLFHAVFIYGMDSYNCTDLFIEVNPRHRRFYQAMLGFRPIGEVRTNPTVDAPSQLMWISVAEIAEQITAFRSGSKKPSRSLYSLFLSDSEEMMVRSRLSFRRQYGSLSRIFERGIAAGPGSIVVAL